MKTNSPNLLHPDQKTITIKEIINFFKTEREETIGVIAAEEMLDMFLENTGKEIYNKAVDDAVTFLKSKIEGIDFEMETSLKK